MLLHELFERTREDRGGEREDERTVLAYRIQRLYALALIRSGDPEGRLLLLDLFETVGGIDADAAPEAKPLSRLLSDFCADLSNIGLHDEAVAIAQRMADRETSDEVHIRRTGNVAAWLLQRAVRERLSERPDAAKTDLRDAARLADLAIDAHRRRVEEGASYEEYELREVKAISLAVRTELAAIDAVDAALIGDFRDFMRETERAKSWEETYLQKAYRTGRFGHAYMQRSASKSQRWRGRIYLQLAWDSLGNALTRHWLPVALHEAIRETEGADVARDFARLGAEKLMVQCGETHPAVATLTAAAT
jgi:hypothetical protein